MKRFILLVTFMTVGLIVMGQSVTFRYDNSGNRTSRNFIALKSTSGASSDISPSDTYSDQLDKQSVLIYPNPVRSEITVELKGLEENTEGSIVVFDQGGRLVVTHDMVSSNNTLDLSHLSAGTYIMVIRLGSSSTKWTIVKE